ncbi:hypothetical protein ACQP2F_32495 [Actinoplanes sp. CA-030573]|uniref:hypothetical protein n=1 Tax=Actinoplanes sp. CA-030573 TaxID=3239898 RepID=UPI003D91265D
MDGDDWSWQQKEIDAEVAVSAAALQAQRGRNAGIVGSETVRAEATSAQAGASRRCRSDTVDHDRRRSAERKRLAAARQRHLEKRERDLCRRERVLDERERIVEQRERAADQREIDAQMAW